MARTQVQSELIATNAISGTIIADNAITATHIATNAISGTLVQSSGITTDMIASNNVTAAKIVSDGIETRHLHSNVISGQSSVTAASGDYVLIGDTSDSNNLKKALVSDFGVSGISSSADATAITIDSSERVLIGGTTGIANVVGTGALQVLGTGNSDTCLTIGRFSANSSPPSLAFTKSRNGTIGSNTIIQDGDNLGQIVFSASDGNDMLSNAAKIEVEVDGTPGADDLPGRMGFYTTADGGSGATERMRITSAGNVGIGTSSPIAPLHVSGNAVIETGSPDLYLATTSASHTNWRIAAQEVVNQGFEIASGTTSASSNAVADTYTTRLTILSDGTVGIGTTSPTHHLHVNAGSTNVVAVFESSDTEATVRIKDSTGTAAIKCRNDFRFNKSETTEMMRLNNDGKLIIGDTGSHVDDLLQIETPASGGGTGIQIRRNDSNNDQGIGRIMFGNNTDTDLATINVVTDGDTDCARFAFHTQASGGSSTERMRLDQHGRFLINKTSSSLTYGKLQVGAGGETAGHGGIVFFEDTDTSVGSSNVIQVNWFTGDNDATGGVFNRFRDGNSVMGEITAANGTQVSYGVSSDERLKENIVDASSQLNTIKNVKVREFDWKANGYHEVGMIAQELHTVIPSAVQEGEDDVSEKPWSVDYSKLTPYLIKAVQELSAELEAAKARITTLEG